MVQKHRTNNEILDVTRQAWNEGIIPNEVLDKTAVLLKIYGMNLLKILKNGDKINLNYLTNNKNK